MGLAKAATLCLFIGLTQQSLGDDKFFADDLLIMVQSQESVGDRTGLIGQLELFLNSPTEHVFSRNFNADDYSVRASGVSEAPLSSFFALARHLDAEGGLRGKCAEYTTIKSPAFPGRKVKLERDRVVIALRQRGGRTRTFVRKTEGEGVDIAKQVVAPDALLFTDAGRHWSRLNRLFDHREVNHSKVYSDHGKNTNGVESYFSRLRRMVIGQHHGVSAKYLHQYAGHCAWLEDHRRRDNGTNARAIVADAMAYPVSRNWKGYWQRSA